PIIALTAHAMQGDRQRCLDADMDGYVSKPIQPVELFEVIDRVIARHAERRAHTAPAGAGAADGGSQPAPEAAGHSSAEGPIVDRALLDERVQGDAALLESCIRLFLSDYPARLDAINEAIGRGDGVRAAQAAHALKGAVAMFSTGPAWRAAQAIEHLARGGDLAGARRELEVLARELARLQRELERLDLPKSA